MAVELGELEGKFSALAEIWGEREKRLQQTIDWEAFKMNSDQVVAVLIIHTSSKLLLKKLCHQGVILKNERFFAWLICTRFHQCEAFYTPF